MKVYEVRMEDANEKEIRDIIQYVSGDSLFSVTNYFSKHAEELDYELKSVRYVLTVVQRITNVD